jgi:Ribosomal protein S3AE
MDATIHQKAAALSLDQFVQEMVLGKIASDIYNQAKEVAPLRHVGIRKSKLLAAPQIAPVKEAQVLQAPEAQA